MLTLLLVACSTEPTLSDANPDSRGSCFETAVQVGDGIEAGLEANGCGYTFHAVNDDQTIRLLLDAPAFEMAMTDGAASEVYELPDDAVALKVESGCELDAAYCTDVVEGTAVVERTYAPTAGMITIDAVRDEESGEYGGDDDSIATIILEGVVLDDGVGNTVTIASMTWRNIRLYMAYLG